MSTASESRSRHSLDARQRLSAHPSSDTPDGELEWLLARARKLRVAIISDAAPERNGVGTYYVDLVAQLSGAVEEIDIFSPTIENGRWRAGMVFSLPGDPTQKLCLPNPLHMARFLRRLQAQVVIVATPGVYGLCGAFLAARMGIPVIAGFHTSFEQLTELYWKNSALGKLVLGYFKLSNAYLFRRCQLVLANSDDMVAQAQRHGAAEARLIGTGISPLFTREPVQPGEGRVSRVLFAGRLAPEKNIQALVAAAEQRPELHFTLAGDGPLMPDVRRASAALPNLECLGWIDRERLRQEIDRHDLLVLPSQFESFGTIALEAMARQRLVLVSEQCGIAQWAELRRGLYVMPQQGFLPTLDHICQQNEAALRQKAVAALELTRRLNRENTGQWCRILLECQHGKLPCTP